MKGYGCTVQRDVKSTQHYTMGTNRTRASENGRFAGTRASVGAFGASRVGDTSHVSQGDECELSRRCALQTQTAARRGLSGVKTHGRWQYVAQRSQHAAGRTRAQSRRLGARESACVRE